MSDYVPIIALIIVIIIFICFWYLFFKLFSLKKLNKGFFGLTIKDIFHDYSKKKNTKE